MTLGAINYADSLGMIPVIEWDRSIAYYDKNKDSLTENPFEYYFQQPAKITLDEALHADNLIIGKISDSYFVKERFEYVEEKAHYIWDCERFKELAAISKKYVRLKKDIAQQMKADVEQLNFTGRIIGVHIRIKGFEKEIKDHPIALKLEDYIIAINRLLCTGKYEKIFLATEELDTVKIFKEKFGMKLVIYNDVQRNEKGNVFLDKSDQHSPYSLGYEVIRDIFTLAKCDALIAGLSNISFCAKITKLSNDKDYLDEIILSRGVSNNDLSAKEYVKKRGTL